MDDKERKVRDALHASADDARRRPGPHMEPHVYLQAETIELLRSEMKSAVAEGLKEAMNPQAAKAFWTVGVEVLQEQATVQTGRFILGGMKAAAKRLLWLTVFLTAMYALGGWQLFVTVWKAVASSRAAS